MAHRWNGPHNLVSGSIVYICAKCGRVAWVNDKIEGNVYYTPGKGDMSKKMGACSAHMEASPNASMEPPPCAN